MLSMELSHSFPAVPVMARGDRDVARVCGLCGGQPPAGGPGPGLPTSSEPESLGATGRQAQGRERRAQAGLVGGHRGLVLDRSLRKIGPSGLRGGGLEGRLLAAEGGLHAHGDALLAAEMDAAQDTLGAASISADLAARLAEMDAAQDTLGAASISASRAARS